MKKYSLLFITRIKIFVFLLVLIFLPSCILISEKDYREHAWEEVIDCFYDYRLADQDFKEFTLFSSVQEPQRYMFRWYKMSDTNDSIIITATVDRSFPYHTMVNTSLFSLFVMDCQATTLLRPGKWKSSLSNLFDTAVVNQNNIRDHIVLSSVDTVEWTMPLSKITDYIAKGYYRVESNLSEPYMISFFKPVGITKTAKYDVTDVFVYFLDNGVIRLEPCLISDKIYAIDRSKRIGIIDEERVDNPIFKDN